MSLVLYDNEEQMKLMVNETVEFIVSESARLIKEKKYGDPNYLTFLMDSLTNCFIVNLLMNVHLSKNDIQKRIDVAFGKQEERNHLPINGPDFFKRPGEP